MPLPLLAVIPICCAAVGAVLGIMYLSRKDVENETKGKKVLFLGLSGAGKTTLLETIAQGTVPRSTRITGGKKLVTPKMEAWKLRLDLPDEIYDYPGATSNKVGEFRKQWVCDLQNVDIIFYIFNIMSIYENCASEIAAIESELEKIKEEINEHNKKHPFLFLIGSHADCHPKQKRFEEIEKEVGDSAVGKGLLRRIRFIDSRNIQGTIQNLFLVAQLNNQIEAQNLIGRVINIYMEQKMIKQK